MNDKNADALAAGAEEPDRKRLPEDDPDHSAHPYDDVTRTIVQRLQRHVILLMNRLFGTSFSGDEELALESTEMMLLQLDGSRVRRGADSHFVIHSGSGDDHAFHFECQTNPDGSVVLRFAEYDLQMAIDSGSLDDEGVLDLYLPHAAVLNLRGKGSSEPKTIRIHDGDQILRHDIKVQNMSSLPVDELFRQDALALLPFYVFTLPGDLRDIAADPERTRQLLTEFSAICGRLETMNASGEISAYEHGVLLELLRKVTRNAVPASTISEEVAEMANGSLLDLDTVRIYETGVEAGEKRGERRGEKRGEERGEKRGYEKSIFSLVRRGKLSIDDGAEELGMTVSDFRTALADASEP